MKITFEKEQQAHLTIDFMVAADLQSVWHLLATTAGYAKWFPQIKAEGLPESGKLTFEHEDLYVEYQLLRYEAENQISYTWGSGVVTFRLEGTGQNQTHLYFEEFLPDSFPNIAQDLSGWTMQMENLKATAEGKPYQFDPAVMEERKQEFQRSLGHK